MMGPWRGLRPRTQGSFQPPTDHYRHNSPEAEMSGDDGDDDDDDGDDDDIPANKLVSVPSSKRLSLSTPRLHANGVKRSLSDTTQGGIVLYPGRKQPRNGYNMVQVSRVSPARSTPDFSSPFVRIHSRTNSPSSAPEDDIPEGLLRIMNDAIHQIQTRQAQDHVEQQLHPGGAPTLVLLSENEAQSEEPEDAGDLMGSQDPSLPLAVPTSVSPYALPLSPYASNNVGEEVKQLFQNTNCATTSASATPNRQSWTNTGVQPRMDTVLQVSLSDIWDAPKSPRQTSALEGCPETTPSNNQGVQLVKKRGRPRKLPLKISPNGAPGAEKERLGRPRKHYPRLFDETDETYAARIARLQKKPMLCFSDPDAQLSRRPPLVPNGTSLILPVAPCELERSSQSYDAHTSTHAPLVIQGWESNVSRPCFNDNNLQLAPEPDLQPKAIMEENAVCPANHAEHSAGESNFNEQNGDFGLEDGLAQCNPSEDGNGGRSNSNTIEGDEMISDFIDEFDSDCGSSSDVDQSAVKDSFAHDVATFSTRHTLHPKDDEVFKDPVDEDILAIHLDYEPLKRLCQLLGSVSWAGVRGNWQWRQFDYDDAETQPARALLPLLEKLDRLYQTAPKAPNLKEQNQFLKKHADMLRYYFHKINMVVEHIRSERLEIPERNDAVLNLDPHKRKRMTRDLVLYVVPMLAHVLASGWGLGGKKWTNTSFTSCAVELLRRALGWIMRLHRRLLGELERDPLEEEPKDPRPRRGWLMRNDRREEIGPLLDNLYEVISTAPDQLAETEVCVKKELQQRQARQASTAEQKKRSLLSIRGIHYRLGPPTSSQPSSTATTRSTEWSVEEQRLLFLRIQASFPTCPDLNDLCWELNKTVAQTVAMTEQILEKMLARVLVGYSVEERAAALRRVMDSSGVAEL
ncbi:hypothetical protein GQX73_g7150 [Xylaria multiplex]|uniref:Uncharacterized protein n=1 Tax=Xylaria multiplex TaxID=323545 RepID=A0A7C8IL83_9PEZI|nr:hypothetical protein GQX73_g7150 [Xylaria multiplex]